MSAINWLFTINNPSELNIEYLRSLFDDDDCPLKYLIFQREQVTTPHLQGYLQCKKKKSMNQVKTIVGDKGTHLEKMKGTPEQSKAYCSKEESRLDGPWEFGTLGNAGQRTDIEEVRDAIHNNPFISNIDLLTLYPDIIARYPRFITSCRNAYQDEAVSITELQPREGWQTTLFEELRSSADPRKVVWYFDEIGGSGKSTFARGFRDGMGRRGFTITGGKHDSIYYAYDRETVVFVDLARVAKDKVPYEVIENMKNGGFLSTKYESVWKSFNIPHVVIFANFLPDESSLSADRWDIRTIKN